MQISHVEVTPVELSLRIPYRCAHVDRMDSITAVFVRVETREGHTAWGCTAVDPAHSPDAREEVIRACRACADRARDLNPLNIEYALDELAYAQQLLQGLVAEGLQGYLPAPLDGWTMTIDEDAAQGMGFIGGGTIARGEYCGGNGCFTITLMADNPMVNSMGAMLGNAQMMAAMGPIVRVNRQNFLNQDGDLSALIGNRILIQAEDGEVDVMVEHLEQMDFREMMMFGM